MGLVHHLTGVEQIRSPLCGRRLDSLDWVMITSSPMVIRGLLWAGSVNELHAHVHQACPTQGLGLQTGRHGSRRAQKNPQQSMVEEGRPPSTGLHELGKVFLYSRGIICWSVALHHLPFFVDKKLGEIPFDAIPQ